MMRRRRRRSTYRNPRERKPKATYLILRAYLGGNYDIQGSPTLISLREIRKHEFLYRHGKEEKSGIDWAKEQAQIDLVKWNMAPLGRIHPHHRKLIPMVEIVSQRYRDMTSDEAHHFQAMKAGKLRIRVRSRGR
jgi:hypothetical protein